MDGDDQFEAPPTALARAAKAAVILLVTAAIFALGLMTGIVTEGNAETFAVFARKSCDQARLATFPTDTTESVASPKQTLPSDPADGQPAAPNQLDGVEAWPANNKIVWSTSVAPGAEVGTILIHNGSDTDNRQLLFRLNGDRGPELAARMYITASADAQITLPTGDYQIDLVSTPRGLPWKDVLTASPKPAFRAHVIENDADDAKKITIPAVLGASSAPKIHRSVKSAPAEPKDYGSLGAQNQM